MSLDKHQAIDKLEEMVSNKEKGYLTASYYLSNLAKLTGDEYDKCVFRMLKWINEYLK